MKNPTAPTSRLESVSQVSCPICRSVSQQKFQKYKHWIWECDRCQHQFVEAIRDRLRLPYPAEDLFWMLFRKVK